MAVNSVSRTNYRYIIYPESGKPRLMQTVDWTIGTELTPDIFWDAGSTYPVAANRREQHQTMEGVGPLSISDMILALASTFPYQITPDPSGDNWRFLSHNGRLEAGFTAPSDYHEMYMHSALEDADAPSYVLGVPALNELDFDIRREGEARMTQRWIATGLDVVNRRPIDQITPPYREINVIENIDWRVSIQRADRGLFYEEMEPVNILRCMIRFPELRQMVYSLNDSSIGYSSTVIKQTQPGIDLHITANTEWKMYLERYGHFYVDIKTRDESFSFRMQAQQTELTAFEIEEDVWMATVMLTPFAAFSPESANPSTQIFEAGVDAASPDTDHSGYRGGTGGFGTLGSTTGFIPEGLNDIYHSVETSKIYVSTSIGTEWPYLWPLESITIDDGTNPAETHPMEFQLSLNVPNAASQTYYNTDTDMWHISTGSVAAGFNWDAGTAPDSTDINTGTWSMGDNAWDNGRWYTAVSSTDWGDGVIPTEGVFEGDPSELDYWITVDDITTSPFTSGEDYTVTLNWKWTPDRFLDINMTNTSFTEL